ncbi:transmembrane emp24 domain-containing protein 5-like isoform X2 [Sinocyclocheilus grahami]|uniref:transmembrane emp24 domain-containing protein 5-like isoform X2 n=1 Tax=Sinocyclocheilus grahami TaxID=75366 RepID=UPI0007AC6131|nr:PREDICTED: transmembrane emp24 domain-containing protein 5-like isoform X2 [Sinocyclocheilus grahami]
MRWSMQVLRVCVACLSLSVSAISAFSQSLDGDFTFALPAARKECFFQTMKKDASLEIEYQVLDGASLDVDFYLQSPSGHVIASDYRKSDGVHAAVSEKVIFFELILDNMGDGEESEDWKAYVQGTDLLDMKLEDIMDTINSVKSRLGKSLQIQALLRAFEARDRNLQESNYERVNLWSCTNLVVMVIVSGVQVYLLRSFFDNKRKTCT